MKSYSQKLFMAVLVMMFMTAPGHAEDCGYELKFPETIRTEELNRTIGPVSFRPNNTRTANVRFGIMSAYTQAFHPPESYQKRPEFHELPAKFDTFPVHPLFKQEADTKIIIGTNNHVYQLRSFQLTKPKYTEPGDAYWRSISGTIALKEPMNAQFKQGISLGVDRKDRIPSLPKIAPDTSIADRCILRELKAIIEKRLEQKVVLEKVVPLGFHRNKNRWWIDFRIKNTAESGKEKQYSRFLKDNHWVGIVDISDNSAKVRFVVHKKDDYRDKILRPSYFAYRVNLDRNHDGLADLIFLEASFKKEWQSGLAISIGKTIRTKDITTTYD